MKKKKQLGEYEFPQFSRESDRIKHNTKIYKDKSIAEAFATHYGVEVNTTQSDYVIQNIEIGSTVSVKFTNVTKGCVNLISNNPKELFTCRHNVWSWSGLDTDKWFEAEVISKQGTQYVVDILIPIMNKFINSAKKTIKNYFQSTEVLVKDLQIQRGGYTGKINIDDITDITGQPYEVGAFIPGSHIALNIERDFNKWVGEDVQAMVMNFTDNNGNISIICSRKKLLNSCGQQSLVALYDMVFRDGGSFDQVFEGVVTGIINSANKKGVFVEIPEYAITGLLQVPSSELVNYRTNTTIDVKIAGIEWDPKREPYKRSREGILYECNLKPILEEIK